MGTILIGNIKGPQGSQGIQGPQGPVGPVGPTGPGADIYNGLDQTEAGVAGLDSYQGRVLDQKKLDVANVANNLTTAVEGYALDARQGKALDEKKLNASAFVVENNLTTTAAGHALDARQGKALNDKVDNKFYYKEYTTTDVSYSAGTPGSRGAQKTFDLDTGVTVVGVFVCFMADSARYIVIPFISASGTTGTKLYVNFYRADSNALGAADHARVRVLYMR